MKKYNGLDPRIFKSLQTAKNLQRSLNDYHVGIYNGLELYILLFFLQYKTKSRSNNRRIKIY